MRYVMGCFLMIKSIIIMRKLFYWAFAFSLCVLMGCKDDGVRVEVVSTAAGR